MSAPLHRISRWLAPAVLAMVLSGCATTLPADTGSARHDPWERFNRQVFAFNESVDQTVAQPVASTYKSIVPLAVRVAVGNVFGNLGDAWSTVNLFLQAKPEQGLNMGLRTAVNTVFGLGGLLEVADELGLERTSTEDLGQTLGRWGVGPGPYIVLPLLGPSTFRDTAVLLADVRDSGATYLLSNERDRIAATMLQLVNTRAKLLDASKLLDDIALDKYVLLRDGFLARRRSLVYDGDPPEEAEAPAGRSGDKK
jgi:phospholipid-binding lipoprotein MlaA